MNISKSTSALKFDKIVSIHYYKSFIVFYIFALTRNESIQTTTIIIIYQYKNFNREKNNWIFIISARHKAGN